MQTYKLTAEPRVDLGKKAAKIFVQPAKSPLYSMVESLLNSPSKEHCNPERKSLKSRTAVAS